MSLRLLWFSLSVVVPCRRCLGELSGRCDPSQIFTRTGMWWRSSRRWRGKVPLLPHPFIVCCCCFKLNLNHLSCALGSDAVTLVRILTNRNNDQRQEIVKTFKEITQKVKTKINRDSIKTQQAPKWTATHQYIHHSKLSRLTTPRVNDEKCKYFRNT